MAVGTDYEAGLSLGDVPTVVLCGGKGSRLEGVTGDGVAKHLLEVDNRRLIEHAVAPFLGTAALILATGHHGEQIQDFFATGQSTLEIDVAYSHEQQQAGVTVAAQEAVKKINLHSEFILTHGDEVVDGLDMEKMLRFHVEKSAKLTVATTTIEPRQRDFMMWEDEGGRVTRLSRNPAEADEAASFGMGTFICSAVAAEQLGNFENIQEFLEYMITRGDLHSFRTASVFHNINTIQDLNAYKQFLEQSVVTTDVNPACYNYYRG